MGLGAKKLNTGKPIAKPAMKKDPGLKLAPNGKSAGAQKITAPSRAALMNKPTRLGAPVRAAGQPSAPPVPKAPPAPIDPRFEPFRVLLEAKRAELAGSLGDTRFGAQGQNGRVAEEDQAAVSHEEFISSKRNNLEFRMLRMVNAALARIARGEYGDCHACEEPISEKRLKAIPWAAFCVKCQDSHTNDEPDISEAATPAGASAVVQAWNW
jgi:DnaK suppressor protein